MSGAGAGIDFSELLAQAGLGYEPRAEAEAAVLGSIGAGAGCVAITGGPGSGKTALAAHLITAHDWCHHFLRIGHTEFTLWRDPYACLASIAFQLQHRFGDEIFPEAVAIDARGTIQDVARSGTVAGVDIERLVAVPWRRERIQVDLDARRIAGDVTGVRIGELVENYRSVPLAAFRELALLEPLRRLRALRPDAHVTLSVDGLDEDEAGHDGAAGARESIAAMLPLGSDCRQVGNLTLVLSARPGRHLDRFLEDGAHRIDLDADAFGPETTRVLLAVVDRALQDVRVREALAALDWPEAAFRDELVEASEGSFLFVRQSFEAVRGGLGAALREGGLPHGLDDIHARILSTLTRQVAGKEREHVLALLDVLAVAQAPLSAAQAARFTGAGGHEVTEALARLRPLLDTAGRDPVLVACYHQSLRESLTSHRHTGAPWHVDAAAAHLRLGAAYVESDGSAHGVDGYGLLFSARHLAAAGAAGAPRLFELVHDGWRAFCRDQTGSNRLFRESIDLARQQARALPVPEALVTTIDFALRDLYVRDAERHVPIEVIEVMVHLGQVQRAIDRVPDDLEPVEYARRQRAIVSGLFARPGPDAAGLAARLIAQAVERLRGRPEWQPREVAALLDACPLDAAPALASRFPALDEDVLSRSSEPAVLAARARMRTRLAPDEANELLRVAFDAATEGQDDDSYGRVLETWAAFDPAAARAHLHERKAFRVSPTAAAGFLSLSRALEHAGWAGTFVQGAQLLLELPLAPDRDPLFHAGVQLEVARQGIDLLDTASVLAVVDRVHNLLAARRDARAHAELADGGLREGELPVRLGLAEIERRLGAARACETLADAWQLLLSGASADAGIVDRLVRLQQEMEPDLLEAYVHTAPDTIASTLWFSVARTGVWPGHQGSREALERVVRQAEQPRPTGWSMYYYAVASRCGLDDLRWAESLLDGAGVHPSIVLRWRVAMASRLVEVRAADAADWLRNTIGQWASQRPNANFADELPALVATLPPDLVDVASAMMPEVTHPDLRRMLAAAVVHGLVSAGAADAERWLSEACAPAPEASADAGLQEHFVLAFVAGQLRACDDARAQTLWQRALDRIEARMPAGWPGYLAECGMLRALQWGVPATAVSSLLEKAAPPVSPGERRFTLPFPSVSPHRIANLPEHEHLVGDIVARVQATLPAVADAALAAPTLSPAGQAYLRVRLADTAAGVPLPKRLQWCTEAVSVLPGEPSRPLRARLIADAAHAMAVAGARSRALTTACMAVEELEGHLVQGETVVVHALGAALGRCVSVACRCGEWDTAREWIWQGRAVGMHGFHVLLGEVAATVPDVAQVSGSALIEAEARGRNLYIAAGVPEPT